jgi:hypothetical protein
MYLARLIRQKFPDTEKFMEELDAVLPASRVALPQLTADIALLRKDLGIVDVSSTLFHALGSFFDPRKKAVPKVKKRDKADPFKKIMKAFIAKAKAEFEEIEKFFAETEEKFKALTILYGEDPKITPEEFFTALGKFMAAYLKILYLLLHDYCIFYD